MMSFINSSIQQIVTGHYADTILGAEDKTMNKVEKLLSLLSLQC